MPGLPRDATWEQRRELARRDAEQAERVYTAAGARMYDQVVYLQNRAILNALLAVLDVEAAKAGAGVVVDYLRQRDGDVE